MPFFIGANMKHETMNAKICALIDGCDIKLKSGGKYALISDKSQNQLFNTLHRDFGAKTMDLCRIDSNVIGIVVKDWNGKTIIDSRILTY